MYGKMLEFLVKDIFEKIKKINNNTNYKQLEYLRKKEIVSSDEIKTNFGLEKYYSLLYSLGTSKQNFRIKNKKEEIIQEFLESNDSNLLYLAGSKWNGYWFDKRITESLIKKKEPNFLYLAGLEWKANRFSEDIARTLVETKNKEYISLALQNWNKTRKALLEKYLRKYCSKEGKKLNKEKIGRCK
jgi:hypothetical protein